MSLSHSFKRYVPHITKSIKIRALVLDWAGTTVDKYVLGPSLAFKELFSQHSINVSFEQIRKPMGIRKDAHIEELLNEVEVQVQWMREYGKHSTQKDVQKLYKQFIPIQQEFLKTCGVLLPNVAETLNDIQKGNVKIGHTTGFSEEMVDVILKNVKNEGYIPDSVVACDSVLNGNRPSPHMIYKNMDNLNIKDIRSVIKVDDSVTGIEEGLSAGCWTVGVYKYSNHIGYNSIEDHPLLLSNESIEDIKEKELYAFEKLRDSGAHYVVATINDLPCIIRDLNNRLADYEYP